MTKWTASEMGRKGDGSKSPAKQAAVRENGRRGGETMPGVGGCQPMAEAT